jgi:hypothetical protein
MTISLVLSVLVLVLIAQVHCRPSISNQKTNEMISDLATKTESAEEYSNIRLETKNRLDRLRVPHCGVHDENDHQNRHKRYAIEGKKWKNHRITWR